MRKTDIELKASIRNAVWSIKIAHDSGFSVDGSVDREMLGAMLRISEGLAVDARRLLDRIDEEQEADGE